MWKTVIVLLCSLITLPLIAFYYDSPPNAEQWMIIKHVTTSYLILASLCFLISVITKNYSQVDKIWSIAPIFYAWQIAYITSWDSRMVLIASVITIWGIRLTYNFSRRGGYSWKFWEGEEDYRWAVLRAKPEFQAPWKWFVFNLLFISFYQMGLVLAIVFPMIKAKTNSALSWVDFLIALIVVFWVVIEFIADQQQFNFQKEKYRRIEAKEELGKYAHGFVRSGLWSISRHPNYASEQLVWITIYFFSVAATGSWVNWSVTGAILLLLLFYGSSDFSEGISVSKYSEYKDYQKKVRRFIPWIY
jgi:steroid 5-alpha reductase family enzyme